MRLVYGFQGKLKSFINTLFIDKYYNSRKGHFMPLERKTLLGYVAANLLIIVWNVIYYLLVLPLIDNLLVFWLSYFFFWGTIGALCNNYQRPYTDNEKRNSVWIIYALLGLVAFLLARFVSPAFYPILYSCWGVVTGGIVHGDIMYARKVLQKRWDY